MKPLGSGGIARFFVTLIEEIYSRVDGFQIYFLLPYFDTLTSRPVVDNPYSRLTITR